MKSDPVFLGIDTSNYTTSAAAVDAHGNILADNRRLLEVKKGEKVGNAPMAGDGGAPIAGNKKEEKEEN